MILYVLFGQRKEDYPEQHAPEALEIMDEYAAEQNAEWLEEKRKEYEETGEFVALRIMEISGIEQADIRSALMDPPKLEGRLEGAPEDGEPIQMMAEEYTFDSVTNEPIPEGSMCWWVQGVGYFKESPTPAAVAWAKGRHDEGRRLSRENVIAYMRKHGQGTQGKIELSRLEKYFGPWVGQLTRKLVAEGRLQDIQRVVGRRKHTAYYIVAGSEERTES